MIETEKIRLVAHLCSDQGDAVAILLAIRALGKVKAKALGEITEKIAVARLGDVGTLTAKDRNAVSGANLLRMHNVFDALRTCADEVASAIEADRAETEAAAANAAVRTQAKAEQDHEDAPEPAPRKRKAKN